MGFVELGFWFPLFTSRNKCGLLYHFSLENKTKPSIGYLTVHKIRKLACFSLVGISFFFFSTGLNFLQHLRTSPEGYAHFTLSGDYYNRELSGEIPRGGLFSYLSLGNSLFYYRSLKFTHCEMPLRE